MKRAGSLAYLQYGKGSQVYVGFHGWSGSKASFDPLIPFLPPDTSFISFDLPGAGDSPSPRPWTFAQVTEEIDGAMEALSFNRCTLVGTCAGIAHAGTYAAKYPEKVERLVMIDPFVYLPWYFRIFTLPGLGRLLYALTFANPLGRMITNGALAHRRTEGGHLTEGFRDVRHGDNQKMLCALLTAARVALPTFHRYQGPVDLLVGQKTFQAVRQSVAALQSIYARSESHVMVGAAHLPVHEQPVQTAKIVFALNSSGSASTRRLAI